MKKALYWLSAASALVFATPSYAQVVTATNVVNGNNNLSTKVDQSQLNTADSVNQVYGTTGPTATTQNVQFTGGTALQAVGSTGNAALDISNGGGFANIKDSTADTATLYSIIINPDQLFTDMQFSVQLTGPGTLNIYSLLSGGGGYSLCSTCTYVATDANTNYIIDVSGGGATFDGIQVVASATGSPLKELKQISLTPFNPSAVPEPATWAMMLLGFAGTGYAMRRSRRRSAQATFAQIA